MATFNYSGMADRAEALILKFGQVATLVQTSRTIDNAAKPWLGNTATETTEVVTAVFTSFDNEDVDDTLIRRTDVRCLIASDDISTVDVDNSDQVRVGAEQYNVVNVDTIDPGATPIIHILQLRK